MTNEHPNIQLIKRFYDCFAKGDLETMKNELLAPDVTWTIPGHHPLAGTKHGADEVFAFFQQLAKANFKAEVIFLGADETYVVDVHRGYGALGDKSLDMKWVLVYKIENGKIKEVQNFAADQHTADLFFWSVYRLKPLPDRLE
jgi:uncharacterized protein